MKCYVHPDVDAVGTCTNCGKSVCSNCIVEMNGKVVCKACVDNMAAQPSPVAPPVIPPAITAPASPSTAPAKKEPFLSLILSFLGFFVIGFIGLGQIYNGQVKKGIILTLANWGMGLVVAVVYIIGAVATLGIGAVCCLPVFLVPAVLWFYAMYDAYSDAEKINRGEHVKDWLD